MRVLVLFTILFALPFNVLALDDQELFSLSLEELMQIEIVSMTSESVSQAPGISSVYYVDELKSYGLSSMKEFLEFALGVLPNDQIRGITNLQMRGISDANNQKILYMVDGVPYWMPASGDVPLNDIPIAGIEKIEIIRGPASVIYGTNSSAGVINVVTKSASGGEIEVSGGSTSYSETSFYHSIPFADGALNFAAEIRNDSGFSADLFNSSASFDGSCFCFPTIDQDLTALSREHKSFFATYRSDWLNLMIQHYEEYVDGIDNNSVESPIEVLKKGTLISANHILSFNSGELKLFADWNNFYKNEEITNLLGFVGIPGDGSIKFGDGDRNNRWRAGVNFKGQINDRWTFLLGTEYEHREVGDQKYADDVNGTNLVKITQDPFNFPFEFQSDGSILLIEADALSEKALFGQLTHKHDDFQWLVGLRYVNNSMSGNNISPRTSFVYQFDEQNTLKLMYTEGFNSPTFRQLSARNSSGYALDVDVEAETVQSWDVMYSYTSSDLYQSIGAFHVKASNLIESNFESIGNSDEAIRRRGLEYEVRYQLDGIRLHGAYTYLLEGNEERSKDESAFFNPKTIANLGGIYRLGQNTFGMSLNIVGSRANVKRHNDLTVRYSHDVSNWTLSASIHNLLGEDIITPNTRIFDDIRLQTHDDRAVKLGLKISF